MSTIYVYNSEYDGLCISNEEPYLDDENYTTSDYLSCCEQLLRPFGVTSDKVPSYNEGFLKINLSVEKIEKATRDTNLKYTDITPKPKATKSKKDKK